MKKLLTAIMLTLAVNFLAAVGGVGWLYQSGHLDKSKMLQVRDILFAPASSATTQPSGGSATTQPTISLDDLLARQAGRPAVEQVQFIQRTFDTQMLELDMRQRQLADLQKQVDLANQKLAADRAALQKEKKALADKEQESQKLETDKGFQDSLAVYNAIPTKQVKDIFITLNQDTVRQYLQAMDARRAGAIVKEFKSPEERAFIQKVLESMREAQAASSDGTQQ